MKKLLVVGAGFLQSFIIKRAKEMGYYTIAIDKNPKAFGFQYADEYEVIDIVDQNACLKYAESKGIDGVITGATDFGVLSTSFIAEQMNLKGLEYKVAKIIKNKYMVRRILSENNIDDMSQHYEISNIYDVDQIKSSLRYPVMVKPCDGSGSKGARRVNSELELKDACNKAISTSLIGKALIEDFIEGREYGVESLVYNGEVHILGVLGKYMTAPPTYAELGHFFPSQLNIEDKVKDLVKNVINVLGINFGAVNMDVLVTEDNRVYIIDIGARMGGNLIGSHIIPFATGIDYIGNLINMSLGMDIDLSNKLGNEKFVESRLLVLKPGKVLNVPNIKEIIKDSNTEVFSFLEQGKVIRQYRTNLDGCGYIISKGNNRYTLKKQIENLLDKIDKEIIRDF